LLSTWYWPPGQAVQAEAPLLEKVPTAHAAQVDEVVDEA
jgi:hypothetical protein